MTDPKHARNVNGRRVYTNPHKPGLEYDSVTTIIRHGVPKPLDNWMKRTVAEYAVHQHATWVDMPPEQAVGLIKKAPDRIRDNAGDIGNHVHQHLDHRANGTTPPPLQVVCPDAIPSAEQGERFLAEWTPRFIATEHTVYDDDNLYAGSFDFIADLPGYGRVLGDYKTSKGVYPETGLQLAAYRYARYMLNDQDEQEPIPGVDGGVVVHIRPEGYEVVPVECDTTIHDRFLAAREIMLFRRDRTVVGPPLQAPAGLDVILRANLVERVDSIKTAGQVAALAAVWPAGIGTFKQQDAHTLDELNQITLAVELVERDLEAPFNPPPANPPEVRREKPVVLDRVDRATPERHEQTAARVELIPVGWRQPIEQAATLYETGNLRHHQATDRQLDLLGEIVEAVHADWQASSEATQAALTEATENDEQLARALRDCAQYEDTPAGHQRLTAVAGAAAGTGLVMVTDNGTDWHCRPTEGAAELLEERHGSKTAVGAAAKDLAARHGLPKPPRAAADVAADPLMVALLLANNNPGETTT